MRSSMRSTAAASSAPSATRLAGLLTRSRTPSPTEFAFNRHSHCRPMGGRPIEAASFHFMTRCVFARFCRGSGGPSSPGLLLMRLRELTHALEPEVDMRHLARMYGSSETLLGVSTVDPARLQTVPFAGL